MRVVEALDLVPQVVNAVCGVSADLAERRNVIDEPAVLEDGLQELLDREVGNDFFLPGEFRMEQLKRL